MTLRLSPYIPVMGHMGGNRGNWSHTIRRQASCIYTVRYPASTSWTRTAATHTPRARKDLQSHKAGTTPAHPVTSQPP